MFAVAFPNRFPTMLKGVAAGFLAYAMFATSDASSKGLGPTMSVFEILFFLTLVASTTFGLAKAPHERWRDMFSMNRPVLVLIRSVAGVVGGLLGVYSFTTLKLAEAYSLLFLMPAFATILSIPILGEKVGWRRWTAVAIGFVGVLLVVRPGFRELHLGHLAAAAAAMLGAVAIIVLRIVGRSEQRMTLLSTLYVSALVVDGVLMIPHFHVPGPREILIFTVGGIFGGLGQIAMLVATRHAPPSRVAPAQYSQIVWAIIFGAVFFHEYPDGIAFIGIALVVLSGLVTLVREEHLHGWSARTFLLGNRQ